MEKNAEGGRAGLGLRMTLTWFVGCGITTTGAPAVAAAAFGGLAFGAVGVVIVLSISTVAMATVHRITSGSGIGTSTGWGFFVSLSSLTLALLTAVAWQQSGRPFGSMPLLWVAVGGLAFVLCAAAASRRTSVPAGLAVASLVVVSVISLVPAGPLTTPGRGCIAQSYEEAAANCP